MKLLGILVVLAVICSFLPSFETDPNDQQAWIQAVVAVAGLGLAAYQGYQANQQAKLAKELADTATPIREVPPSARRAQATAGYLAGLTQAPGSALEKAYAEEKAAEFFEESKGLVRTSGEAQGLLENKYADLTEAQRLREAGNLAFQGQAQGRLSDINRGVANLEYDIDTTNISEPFYRRMAASSALRGASEANKAGAINSAFSTLSQFGGYYGGTEGGGDPFSGDPTRQRNRVGARAGRQVGREIRRGEFDPLFENDIYQGKPYAPGYLQYQRNVA